MATENNIDRKFDKLSDIKSKRKKSKDTTKNTAIKNAFLNIINAIKVKHL